MVSIYNHDARNTTFNKFLLKKTLQSLFRSCITKPNGKENKHSKGNWGLIMESPGDTRFKYLPGTDALKSAEYFNSRDNLGKKVALPYIGEGTHRHYLDNPTFDKYLQIPKLIVDAEGAQELIEIGDELATETMPRFLEAAGWAYAEAALALNQDATIHRVQLVNAAEQSWRRALVNNLDLGRRYKEAWTTGEDSGHRTAMNLAFAPLIKSIVVGNVTKTIIDSVLQDTAAIASDAAQIMDEAYEKGDKATSRYHWGFLFEANALMTLLSMDDPRYVPLPSTARADTGYYHRSQTHDISIINQHWGEIRKVIPVEIKSRSTRWDRNRYKALLIRGKMHLSISDHDPRSTVRGFQNKVNGIASEMELDSIEEISAKMRDMLRLYQQGTTPEGLAINSLTRFYDTNKVAEVYPELSKLPRKSSQV
jgi:hypothetical protein